MSYSIDHFGNVILPKNTSLPGSVHSLYRAQILILLDIHGPTTRLHIHELGGFAKKFVSRVFRDLISDDLVLERYNLYRTTEQGRSAVKLLKQLAVVMQWLNPDSTELSLSRPDVTKL